MGKVLAIAILATALIAGAALYYLQVYHFYEEVTLASEGGELTWLTWTPSRPIRQRRLQTCLSSLCIPRKCAKSI